MIDQVPIAQKTGEENTGEKKTSKTTIAKPKKAEKSATQKEQKSERPSMNKEKLKGHSSFCLKACLYTERNKLMGKELFMSLF